MAGKKQQILNDKLIMAAQNGHFIDAKKWIRKGAQVDQPVEELFGITPIIIALGANPWTKGHYDIVHFLLKNGACPNQKYPFDEKTMSGDVPYTHREMSLLAMEVYHGRLGVLQLLVKHGADVNQKTEGNIGPLDVAIESEKNIQSMDLRVQIVKFLLENNVFTEYKDKTRKLSPFHRAVEEGHFEVVKLLIQHGVDMESRNYFDNTPIITAAHKGHLAILKLLLEQSIDINSKGSKDYSMLHFAVEDFNIEMVAFLLENGANVNALTGKNNTPLHSACNDSDHHLKRMKVTEILLKYGADISARNIAGATPLHSAAEYGLNLAVDLFLKKIAKTGATIDICGDIANMFGRTPLFCAALKGHLYIVKMLTRKGANVNFKDSQNSTVLHSAANNGHVEICEYLIKNGADIEAKDFMNRTPLHCAVEGDCARENEFQSFKTVECFIKYGANLNAEFFRHGKFWTPLDCANVRIQCPECPTASIQKETRVQKLLKKNGAKPSSSKRNNEMSKLFSHQCQM